MMSEYFRKAGDEIKEKGKQMKDSVAETANTAKDKLNDGAQHVKDGTEKGSLLIVFSFLNADDDDST